jgi:hypothetical protein
MADTFRLLPDLDLESAVHGAKSYPETSAQHHALWAAIMAATIRRNPLEADRYMNSAETCAELALAAPIAEPTQTGVKSVQETTADDGAIGLRLCVTLRRGGPARRGHAQGRLHAHRRRVGRSRPAARLPLPTTDARTGVWFYSCLQYP